MNGSGAASPGQVNIVGAGGHAMVIADVAYRAGASQVVLWAKESVDLTRFPKGTQARPLHELDAATPVVLGFGDLQARRTVREQYPVLPPAIIDPSAIIGYGVRIGPGTVVFAGVIVNAGAHIERDGILNTACVVEHECEIGINSHLSPGVRLAGGVVVGANTHLGIGAVVLPRVRIGTCSVVGAGAVVLRDVNDDAIVVGIPARAIRR